MTTAIDENRLRFFHRQRREAHSVLLSAWEELRAARKDLFASIDVARVADNAGRRGGLPLLTDGLREEVRAENPKKFEKLEAAVRVAQDRVDSAGERHELAGSLWQKCRDYCEQIDFPIPADLQD